MQINLRERVLTLKVVYYGPALSGKTTNLLALYQLLAKHHKGRLITLDTQNDRTIYFDLLPVVLRAESGFKVKIKLFTVPGQVIHNTTRRVVLKGTDGVVFVANSQNSESRMNTDSWNNLRENLLVHGLNIDTIPIVVQFNKRDLPDIISEEEIKQMNRHSLVPTLCSIAIKNEGIVETIITLLENMWHDLDEKHDFVTRLGMTRKQFQTNIYKVFFNRNRDQ